MLVLGVLWWSWVGYAWLTSVVDPEEGAVRLVIFVAMAALLVVALCVPGAFDDGADLRARLRGRAHRAHRAVRARQPRRPALRKSVVGLAGSTAIGGGLLVGASVPRRRAQGALWAARAPARHGRAVLLRRRGLEAVPRATSPSAMG